MADTPCDPNDVALAALTNLVRLMGVELVAGKHRDDVGLFEQAVRGKIGTLTVNGCAPEIAETGLALARAHAELALAQVRTQAAAAQAYDIAAKLRSQKPAAAHSTALVLH